MKFFIAGGAGFIGSTLAHKLVEREPDCEIVIYDNLSNGRLAYIIDMNSNPNVEFIWGDIKDLKHLTISMAGCDIVYHLASNADISKAVSDPTIDFWEGTYLTQNILEAMRINGIKRIIYASGSGVYGDWGRKRITEIDSPMTPTSTYGASKLAGEALISAYCYMFNMKARIYRFANVVGGNQTHGIVSDLIKKLIDNPNQLNVLGNGNQTKCYVYVDDILEGIFLTEGGEEMLKYYNISSETYVTVKEIVDIILEEAKVWGVTVVEYGDTVGGWKGDIPIVCLNSEKIAKKGWKAQYTSREAIRKTAREILDK